MSLSSSPHNDKTRAISNDKNGAANSDEPSLFLADHLGIASRTNPWAVGGATLVNGVFLALLLCMGFRTTIGPGPRDPAAKTDVDLSRFLPIVAEKTASAPSGGSGNHELIDRIEGRLPRFEENPIAPPQIPVLDHPQLAIDPAIAVPLDMKLPDNPSMPTVGVFRSPNVKVLSGGPGSNGGIGVGMHGTFGPGSGPGIAPGNEGGVGSYIPGVGGVSNPIPLVTPEAEFSDEARRQKYQGVCLVAVIVDAQGNPRNARVTRSLGMGLDEKALDAVRKYKFKPAKKDGKPVPVWITVEVDFRLY
jgi:periplasmic protein TonB